MQAAVLLAIAAGFCTATASLAQRQGAKSVQVTGRFDARLLLRLAHRPIWLLGIVSMIGGFVFQLTALRHGPLALVQPILSIELILVFGFLAIAERRRTRIKLRDWLGAAAMSAGLAVFLRLASPSGGRLHAAGSAWLLAGLVTLGVVAAAIAVASGIRDRSGAAPSRRAALLGSATGIGWGFVAAVIKELSSHLFLSAHSAHYPALTSVLGHRLTGSADRARCCHCGDNCPRCLIWPRLLQLAGGRRCRTRRRLASSG